MRFLHRASSKSPRRNRLMVGAVLIAALGLMLCLLTLVPHPIHLPDGISSIWANDGGDKVTQSELRGSSNASSVLNSIWDGTTISVFGARNEVVNFNLILESAKTGAKDVSVNFAQLVGPEAFLIQSKPAQKDEVFDWRDRPIEVFYVDYLQIKGLSVSDYGAYDERHVPEDLRRTWIGEGVGVGTWEDRPNHDAFYPDIAIPLELVPTFDISAGSNQSLWVDIYIPEDAPAGFYQGTVRVTVGTIRRDVPVMLTVYDFALPDVSSARTMLYVGYQDVNLRYLGEGYPQDKSASTLILNRHFMLAHRHRISLIGADDDGIDKPLPTWLPRLNGSLFTAINGYDGPGVGEGNGIYSIGTYGTWLWDGVDEASLHAYADQWVTWFDLNSPETDYFLYLIDESKDYAQTEQWAQWINSNSGMGNRLFSMATMTRLDLAQNVPGLDIVTALARSSIRDISRTLADSYRSTPGKQLYFYNGSRPVSGTFTLEDDGIALRQIAWAQYKMGIDRWFQWESTYYNNFHSDAGQTNVFETAQTYGKFERRDTILGETGEGYTNGGGVLFYPGTDTLYPQNSYGVNGPFASLRLKHWRRGIQDVDYLTMANAIDPDAVAAIAQQMVPTVLWEYGVGDISDPTWVRGDISWSTDPDVWETARAQLAAIIVNGASSGAVTTP